MRFSLTPQPGESGFIQWLDAMKMVARLQGGIPPEFRKRVSVPRSTIDNEFDEDAVSHGKRLKIKDAIAAMRKKPNKEMS